MRVLFPVLGFIRSGGFRVLSRLASEAAALGHEAVIVCAAEIQEPYFPVDATIVYVDEQGKPVPAAERHAHVVKSWRKMLALYRYLKRHACEYDAVVASSNLTVYPIWAGSRSRNFYYIQAYEPEFYEEVRSLPRRLVLTAAAWLSYHLPLTRIVNAGLYRRYKNLRAEHVVVPGLDLAVYHRKGERLPFRGDRPWVVGCIGRPEVWKGAFDVSNAVRDLHARGVNIDFHVAFNAVPHERHTLVHPHGDDRLADYYRSLDVLVAPGHLQLGAVHYPVIEGMACGVPVITTGYQPADDSNAYLVPVKSPEAIAAAIERIMAAPGEAQSRADRAFADVARFAWPEVARHFFDILASPPSSRLSGPSRKHA
jgi:glycosyltransferase involved in cell wall biosynthesis